MPIIQNPTLPRDADNTIDVDSNYNELNIKAKNLADDVVEFVEAAAADLDASQAVREAALQDKVDEVMSVNPDGTYYTKAAMDNKFNLMTRAEFEALAAQRREEFAGSGFVEWGKHLGSGGIVNEGLWNYLSAQHPNTLFWGRISTGAAGQSKTALPTATINGYLTALKFIGGASSGAAPGKVEFPPAPATADLLDRQDLVFLEVWHEDVSEKDIVYPYGNVQLSAASYTPPGGSSIPLDVGAFAGADTYALFGNWQAAGDLVGKGIIWSTMTGTQKQQFCAEPENNMYLDGDKIIQVRYRIRVIAGLGSTYENTTLFNTTLRYNSSNIVLAKGKQVSIANDFASSGNTFGAAVSPNIGAWQNTATALAHSGLCFALPICLVHRRNSGAYSVLWNSNGSAVKGSNAGLTSGPTSLVDCFTGQTGGFIGGTSGRPDGLFYDEINERDVLDLRTSAHKVTDLKRTLEREFNKLVAGTTRGWEKAKKWGPEIVPNGDFEDGAYGWAVVDGISFVDGRAVWNGSVQATLTQTQQIITPYKGKIITVTFDLVVDPASTGPGFRADVVTTKPIFNTTGTHEVTGTCYDMSNLVFYVYPGFIGSVDNISIREVNASEPFASKTLLHCDIIGDPANYPQEWKDNGVAGTPLLVGENGEDLIPDGTSKTFKLSRKVKAALLYLMSGDSGVTWETASMPVGVDGPSNSFTASLPGGGLRLVFYLTEASPFELAANAEVLALGGVWAGNRSEVSDGVNLVSFLLNKIPALSTAFQQYLGRPVGFSIRIGDKLGTAATQAPQHQAASLSGTDPAAKALPYLTRANGKLLLQLLYKEMRHNGASWGDDDKFNVVDNESTTTDLNGETIKIGQKRLELPYFIGDGE